MSNETRHALALAVMSPDTLDALDEIALLSLSHDALDLALADDLDLDLDALDALTIDPVAYFDASAFAVLDNEIDLDARDAR